MAKWIEVRTISGNELVSVIDLPDHADERYIEKVLSGMLINLNPRMYVADKEGEKKPLDPRKMKS